MKMKFARFMTLLSALLIPLVAILGTTTDVYAVTTTLHVTKYDAEGINVTAEKAVNYEWLRDNLPVQGDGKTHYYHQGPVFEGDPWDPAETTNLKDKGAVKGTSVKDLCDLVGGMSSGDEVMLLATDGYHLEFGYSNIYEYDERQGPVTLCWYNGEDALDGERYGTGYPSAGGYATAFQVVFQAQTKNPDGKFVFGNTDMQVCLPETKYQHFYEGLASTNGLSGKWISRVYVYPADKKPDITIQTSMPDELPWYLSLPWLSIGLAAGGVFLIVLGVFDMRRVK